jgi:hypothetical protein
MRTAVVALALVAVLAGAVHDSDPLVSPDTIARYFRLEWQVNRDAKRPVIKGLVYNEGFRDAEHMHLQIDRLDAAGAVEGTSSAWVLGKIGRSGGRAYFTIPVAAATSYRIQVLSFDWTCGEGGGGAM